MELQVGVKILIKNTDGTFLFLKRSPIKYPETQKWDIPGGRIDVGSTLMANLAREVAEETTLSLVGTPRLIAAQDILKSTDKHVVRLTYVGEAEGDVVLGDEHVAYQWFSLSELQTLDPLDSYVKAIVSEGLVS